MNCAMPPLSPLVAALRADIPGSTPPQRQTARVMPILRAYNSQANSNVCAETDMHEEAVIPPKSDSCIRWPCRISDINSMPRKSFLRQERDSVPCRIMSSLLMMDFVFLSSKFDFFIYLMERDLESCHHDAQHSAFMVRSKRLANSMCVSL